LLPVGPEISYTIEKEGYGRLLTPDVFTENGSRSAYHRSIGPDEYLAEQYGRVDSPYPMRFTGTILLNAGDPSSGSNEGLAGVTFNLLGATRTPFYWDEEADWSPDLTETNMSGRGGFTEVTPGFYRVKFGGAADDLDCVASFAWPSDEPNAIRLEVREGYMTRASAVCSP